MKNKIFNLLFLLIIIFSFTGCFNLKYKPKISKSGGYSRIYGILENGKINRMGIPENDIYKMNEIFGREYGISFYSKYDTITAMKVYNKNYDNKKDFSKNQYIKFYDDIKVTIGEKIFIVPKEKIVLNEVKKGAIFYEYSIPVDIYETPYDTLIVNLGTIEIYDETGKIQRPKRKIPPVLIKKTFFIQRVNTLKGTARDTLYHGWAEDCPIELQKQK